MSGFEGSCEQKNKNKKNEMADDDDGITCPICCLDFTKQKRISIECPSCKYKICLACLKQLILISKNVDCNCVNCNYQFTYRHFIKWLPPSWISKSYRDHFNNILISQEENLLPETQNEAYFRKIQKRCAEIRKEMQESSENEKNIYKNEIYSKLKPVKLDSFDDTKLIVLLEIIKFHKENNLTTELTYYVRDYRKRIPFLDNENYTLVEGIIGEDCNIEIIDDIIDGFIKYKKKNEAVLKQLILNRLIKTLQFRFTRRNCKC